MVYLSGASLPRLCWKKGRERGVVVCSSSVHTTVLSTTYGSNSGKTSHPHQLEFNEANSASPAIRRYRRPQQPITSYSHFVVSMAPSCSVFSERERERSRSLFAVARPSARPSVVYNIRAPYSGGSNFRQYFYSSRYLGHPLTSTETFTEIVPGEPLRRES